MVSSHPCLGLRTVVTEPERAATRIALHLMPRPEGGWVGFFMGKLTEEDLDRTAKGTQQGLRHVVFSFHPCLDLRRVVTVPERAAARIELHLMARPEGGLFFFVGKLTEED